jgi:Ca-activated chloride channel family protein
VKTLKDANKNISSASSDFKFAAAVALFGQQLRKSEYIKSKDVKDVLKLAEAARGKDDQGYRAEFIRLVKSYK